MKKVDWHFPRKAMALSYLQTVFQGAMSRIALLDVRRTGKTTFLLKDLFPVAIENGFTPVYVNLWAEPESPTSALIHSFQNTLTNLKSGTSGTFRSIANAEVKKLEVGNSVLGKAAIEFSDHKASKVEASELILLTNLLTELAAQCGDKLLLIIDEIQHLASSDKFLPIQHALRTAIDMHNDICVVFAGSSRSGVNAMFSDKDKPFYDSAFMIDFPRLDIEFVRHCCDILEANFGLHYSAAEVAVFYDEIDNSPFWIMKLMTYLMANKASLQEGTEYIRAVMIQDGDFEGIKNRLKPLDIEVLRLIRSCSYTLYAQETLDGLGKVLHKKISTSAVQASIRKLKMMQIISHYGDKYYIESPGFIKYLG